MARYGYICHSNELYHHGIKGQKWGKRNGPPYPLDASDHSAAEKKANNGRYSQGVKQDRGKKKREPMSDEKKRKIKKALAIGAGVAGAAALTAGGIYLAKHPGTAKAAISGVKDLTLAGAKGLKSSINISKIKNAAFKKNAQDKVNASFAKKTDNVLGNIRKANTLDKAHLQSKKIDRKIKGIERKSKRADRKNEKRGILTGDVLSDLNIEKMKDDARFITNNEGKLRDAFKSKGQDADEGITKLYRQAKLRESNRSYGSRKQQEYRDSTGIRGKWNKAKNTAGRVWAPIAGAAGVVGTVGGVAGQISGGINSVAGLANNKYVKKAYNDLTYDPYTQQYYEDQSKKKKKN